MQTMDEETEDRESLLAEYHDELVASRRRARGEGWLNPDEDEEDEDEVKIERMGHGRKD